MKTLKKLVLIVPLSHLFGIGLLALLCVGGKNAADPVGYAKTVGIASFLAAALFCGILSAALGRFDFKKGLAAGAAFAALDLLAALIAGCFCPTLTCFLMLGAALVLPSLTCLFCRPHGTHGSHGRKKRAAARYFAK